VPLRLKIAANLKPAHSNLNECFEFYYAGEIFELYKSKTRNLEEEMYRHFSKYSITFQPLNQIL